MAEEDKKRQYMPAANLLNACDKVRAMPVEKFREFKTMEQLAAFLATELGFPVSRYHANQIMELTKLKTKMGNAGRAPRGTGIVRETNKLRYLARELNRLLMKLGEPSSDALVQIGKGYTPDGLDD